MDASPDPRVPDLILQIPTVAKRRSPRPVMLGTVKSIRRVPRNRAMARPVAGTAHECALGYSGWFGVAGSSGDQTGSPSVALLPSVSPARIAVIGRQRT